MARRKRSEEVPKIVPIMDDDYWNSEDEDEDEDFDGGETRARSRCPLCGMVGDVYANSKRPALPTLETYPFDLKAWLVHYGGFKWDAKTKKRVGVMKYKDASEALVPLMKLYLMQGYDLCVNLVDKLREAGVELPDDLAAAVKALGRAERLWIELDEAFGIVNK